MNPNASEWKPNPTAQAWTPSKPVVPAPTLAPPPAPVATEPVKPPAAEESAAETEEIDEDDPLWKATLQLSLGDRAKALRMLEDPDALMKHPEIRAIMERGESATTGEEEWEGLASEANRTPAVTEVPTETPKSSSPPPEKGSSNAAGSGSVEKTASKDKDDDDDADKEDEEIHDDDPRQHLNLVFIGHVDAGKSTLSGSILYLMGQVDQRTIERFEREAKNRNRESWFMAFIMDTSEEERAKGKTVEVGRAHFETDINRYTILDAPGHKNYVPNMISGAAQADVGILVISARKGEFETGFEKGGQTREHALLARTVGVDHLIVVINKMDDPTVEWSKDRYEECVGKLKPYLKQVGYVIKKDVKFVPISGLAGDNVRKEVSPDKCPWWREMYTSGGHNTTTATLIGTLDALTLANRDPKAPLRIPCLDRYFERGCVVLGKVEAGTVCVGDEIVIMPTRKRTKIEELHIGDNKVRSAKPGENVLLKMNVAVEDIQKGYVLCHYKGEETRGLCPAVREIKAQLALVDMLEHRPIFSPGYEAVMHVHTVEIEVTCVKLLSVIEKGKAVSRPYARQGQQCIAKLTMPLNTCMEPFERSPSLGRLTLRDEGKTIAIGKILELYKPT